MSFSCSIPATPLGDLEARLAALSPSPPLTDADAIATFSYAKHAFGEIADYISLSGDYGVAGSISGHFYTGEVNNYPKNSVNISVSEVDLPVAEPEPVAA